MKLLLHSYMYRNKITTKKKKKKCQHPVTLNATTTSQKGKKSTKI